MSSNLLCESLKYVAAKLSLHIAPNVCSYIHCSKEDLSTRLLCFIQLTAQLNLHLFWITHDFIRV